MAYRHFKELEDQKCYTLSGGRYDNYLTTKTTFGFPFDRPLLNFTERLLELEQQMPRLLKLSKNDESNNIQYLYKLFWTAAEVAEDPEIKSLVEEIQWFSGKHVLSARLQFVADRHQKRVRGTGSANYQIYFIRERGPF